MDIRFGNQKSNGLAKAGACVLCIAGLSGHLGAQCVVPDPLELLASTPDANDRFGTTVAMDGDTLVVAAPRNYDNTFGIVYIVQRAGESWQHVTTFTSPAAVNLDGFGIDLDLDGDRLIVGSEHNVTVSRAFIFERNQCGPNAWGLVKMLTPSDGAAAEFFGHGVAIDGDLAIVGAYGNDTAYIFHRNHGGPDNWGEITKVKPAEVVPSDEFGWHVAIAGDTAMVGAWGDDDGGVNAGAFYIFKRDEGGPDNWGRIGKILGESGFDQMGRYGMQMDGDLAVIGVPDQDEAGLNAGAVYVHRRNLGGPDQWGLETKLSAADGEPQGRFGQSVAINAALGALAAGAPLVDVGGQNRGAAYVFEGVDGTWAQLAKLTDPAAADNDNLGAAVGLGSGWCAAGVPLDDGFAVNAGAVQVFDVKECFAVTGDLNGDGQVGVQDLLILLSAWGDCPRQGDCPADLNGDGKVGVQDLLILLANWG